MKRLIIGLILFILFFSSVHSTTLVLPPKGNLVGIQQFAESDFGETLAEVGRRFSIGHQEMIDANPRIEPMQVLHTHTKLVIPSQFALPKAPRKGIVINLARYRLFYFPPNENTVITFPVGIGKEGWNTPLGSTRVTSKSINPSWHPTKKILSYADQLGAPLPDDFPPGPNNPLGKYALRLGWPTILIHGTNRSEGIGSAVSAGCIRLLPDDMEYLFGMVAVGTEVRVINKL